MKVTGAEVAHIGVAVGSIDEAVRFYRDVLGITPGSAEQLDGATVIPLPLGAVAVELLVPSDTTGPVARFLARRGPGIHHICIRVADLDETLARCRQAGYHLIDERPRVGQEGRRIAFVHPKATAGILIELTE